MTRCGFEVTFLKCSFTQPLPDKTHSPDLLSIHADDTFGIRFSLLLFLSSFKSRIQSSTSRYKYTYTSTRNGAKKGFTNTKMRRDPRTLPTVKGKPHYDGKKIVERL